jgi:hypothetical protein
MIMLLSLAQNQEAWRRWQLRCHAKPIWRLILCWLALAATGFSAKGSESKVCPESPDFYNGYTVENVRIETPLSIPTPLSFLFGVQKKLQTEFGTLLTRLPMQKGATFNRGGNHLDTIAFLGNIYDEKLLLPGERIRISFATARLESCNNRDGTLDVVYVIYSTEFLYYASRIFERRPDKITRALAPGRLSAPGSIANTNNKLLPQPFGGYDSARKLFAGTKASFESKGGIFNRVDLDLSGSPNSAVAELNLAGKRDFSGGWLSHLDWRLGYGYSNLPADTIDLKASTAVAQVFGASHPLGKQELIFRFGASLEGGNRQTDLGSVELPPSALPRSGYGAAKFYLGATAGLGRHSWAASYGLQLGNDGESSRVDYLKHIVDASYRARFLLREHRPLRLEAQFTAGLLRGSGTVPIVERFFGGNKQRSFIQGDDWIINSSPLIRSFPQNGFSRIGLNAFFGGKEFSSFNLTLSHPVWNYPAVPDEISQEPFMRDSVGGQLRTARTATLDAYLSEEPAYIALAKAATVDPNKAEDQIDGNFEELVLAFEPLPKVLTDLQSRTPPPPQEVLDVFDEIGDDDILSIDLIEATKDKFKREQTEPGAFKTLVKELIVGLSAERPGIIPRLVANLADLVEALNHAQLSSDAQQIGKLAQRLDLIRQKMEPKVNALVDYGKIDIAVFLPARAVLKDAAKPDDADRVLMRMEGILERIETHANSVAEVGRSAPFIRSDLKVPARLAAKLRDRKDPVSQYLFTQFTAETQGLLQKFKDSEPLSEPLLQALFEELNLLLRGPSLFEEARFAKARLSDETKSLANQNPQGRELVRLNRSLLAEAYPNEIAKSQLDELIQPLSGYLDDGQFALKAATGNLATSKVDNVRNGIHQLMVGYDELAPAVATNIASEIRRLQQPLDKAGLMQEHQELLTEAAKLAFFQKLTRQAFNGIVLSAAEKKADKDIGYGARSLDVIFRELNLIEVSPVLMFDAARIGPQITPGYGGFRYGLGPGIRFSIVTLDFTTSYSFNLNRRSGEGRGAFLFSMSISDLFR